MAAGAVDYSVFVDVRDRASTLVLFNENGSVKW